MSSSEAKLRIAMLLGSVAFEGHFTKCYDALKETQRRELVAWVERCSRGAESPILSKRDRNIIGFVRRFGSNIRAILTKRKEGCFLVLFLDKHKYYEEACEAWGF